MKKLLIFVCLLNVIFFNVLSQKKYDELIRTWQMDADVKSLKPQERRSFARILRLKLNNPRIDLSEDVTKKARDAFNKWEDTLKNANLAPADRVEATETVLSTFGENN